MNKKQYISKLCSLFFSVIFVLFSCNNEKETKKEVLAPSFDLKIDSLNASAFAKSFVEDVYANDKQKAQSKIQLEYNDEVLDNDTLLLTVIQNIGLFKQLNLSVVGGADLKPIGYKKEGKRHLLTLQLFTPPLEVVYYKLALKTEGNRIYIHDFSSTLYKWSNTEIVNEIIDFLAHEIVSKNDIKLASSYLDSSQQSFNAYNSELAENYFKKIPLPVQNTKLVKGSVLEMQLHSNEEVRNQAIINLLRKNNLRDERFWLYSYYLDMGQEKYPRARINLMNLRELVNEKAILFYLEATTYFEEYNYTKALELYNEALMNDPKIPNLHFAKIICLIEMEEHVQAVESLLVMEDYFDVNNTNWDKEFIAYPEFLMSDEYSRWLERIGESSKNEL